MPHAVLLLALDPVALADGLELLLLDFVGVAAEHLHERVHRGLKLVDFVDEVVGLLREALRLPPAELRLLACGDPTPLLPTQVHEHVLIGSICTIDEFPVCS